MHNTVITINARIHGANAYHGYIIGLPTLPSVWGFLHATGLGVSESLSQEVNFEAFSVAYKDFSLLGRCSLSQNEIRYSGMVKKANFNPPIIERPKSTFEVSVVIYTEHSDLLTPEGILKALSNKLDGSRFSGGTVELLDINISDSYEKALSLVDENSFWICDYNAENKHDDDRFGEMPPNEKIKLLEDLTSVKLKYKFRNEDSDTNWYLPLINGYKGITEPKVKPFSRKGYPHMFAEPVIGIYRARLARSVKNILKKVEDLDSLGLIFTNESSSDSFCIKSST
ncbi:hypothetical protein KW882_05530 [Vibrio parahaemolyticus]